MHYILALWIMFAPAMAFAESLPSIKDPLNYSLRQYGFILAIAMLGGFVGWWSKVRKGELQYTSIMALIGELTTSAFAGLIVFWGCEYFSLSPVLTACLAGLAGHAGGRGVAWLEDTARRKAEASMGLPERPKP